MSLKLPQDLLLGAATSALQIEGGDKNNNWYQWCEEGHIKDGSHCLNANDHWNRYREDIELIKKLGLETYRMGLEWSRIEHQPGKFSKEGIEHYRDEITLLLENGVVPLVTLHHFSHPLWLVNKGGWGNKKVVDYFKRYTEYVVENLGDLVSDWITINEPNVFLYNGYVEGIWPPGKNNIFSMFRAMKNMIKAHIVSYKTIHQVRSKHNFEGETRVGVANHVRLFDPAGNKKIHGIPARLLDYFFHRLVMEGMARGKFMFPIGTGGHPLGEGRYYDFIGINYYTRDIIKFTLNPASLFARMEVKEGADTSDLGWEIYPVGLKRVCRKYYEEYQAPVFITENGICDKGDTKRGHFIYDHLKEVVKLINEGIPVERYYYWTLIDNFEWIEGESARFGLIHNDFKTQKRSIRISGYFYGKICKTKEITPEMERIYL
ncbi:glycoside hydrolase family 1 protein [Halothermothrix orenii]|uniref:Beta-glucosidase n=1 Tax=Halothermothrix orenii (strain H 168 / OCM 544 / DSM 9562) TaxID=373903 RepID=B8D213_HALOH|nr:glycoside hydrolase family 1 protein [Halothermothrix orenii]ACL69240.1 Beta-glucosidase [Halothermothrix orenii H 168]